MACDSMHSRGAHTVQMEGHTCIIEEHICPGVGHNVLSRNISREEQGVETTMEHTTSTTPGGQLGQGTTAPAGNCEIGHSLHLICALTPSVPSTPHLRSKQCVEQ